MVRLMEHDYPGNVRELENIIEQAFVLCRNGRIDLTQLPPELRPEALRSGPGGPMTLRSMEAYLIEAALQRHGGNQTNAARELGINPSTLYRKLKGSRRRTPASETGLGA